MSSAALDIAALSPLERLDLIGRLWDSLDAENIPLSDAQRAELDRRADALECDIAEGRPLGTPWGDIWSTWKNESAAR